MGKTIGEMHESDRPREKLIRKGAAALSDQELLAVLLGKGTPRVDVTGHDVFADAGLTRDEDLRIRPGRQFGLLGDRVTGRTDPNPRRERERQPCYAFPRHFQLEHAQWFRERQCFRVWQRQCF